MIGSCSSGWRAGSSSRRKAREVSRHRVSRKSIAFPVNQAPNRVVPMPMCGWDMSLTSVTSDRRAHGERIFECQMREHFEGVSSKIK